MKPCRVVDGEHTLPFLIDTGVQTRPKTNAGTKVLVADSISTGSQEDGLYKNSLPPSTSASLTLFGIACVERSMIETRNLNWLPDCQRSRL
jgi:hypothetical protein